MIRPRPDFFLRVGAGWTGRRGSSRRARESLNFGVPHSRQHEEITGKRFTSAKRPLVRTTMRP
jgi:hypothetical protein